MRVALIGRLRRPVVVGTLGRLTDLLMLTSFGIFPLSVAIAAIFVRDLGPAPFFLFAAATLTERDGLHSPRRDTPPDIAHRPDKLKRFSGL